MTENRKGRGSMVVCLALADSVGNERNRLSMGRLLKLLGLSNDAPFKKEKQRERKQDISHFWGKEGRKKCSISLYGGGGVGKDRFDIPFEKRLKVGGTNWGYTQSSLLCPKSKNLGSSNSEAQVAGWLNLWWEARLQHWACPSRLWCSLYSSVMPVSKVNRISLLARTLPNPFPYYKFPNTSCRGPVFSTLISLHHWFTHPSSKSSPSAVSDDYFFLHKCTLNSWYGIRARLRCLE